MARTQVFNTKGAAKRLGCSETWIHRLVATGKLKAYIYDDHSLFLQEIFQRWKDFNQLPACDLRGEMSCRKRLWFKR
jgi:hypothetical protein